MADAGRRACPQRCARARSAGVAPAALGGSSAVACLVAVAIGPFVLPTYMVNILIRAFLYAAVALTVDILWGYTGILTFGQSAFFGIGAYAAGLTSRTWASVPGTRRWRCGRRDRAR